MFQQLPQKVFFESTALTWIYKFLIFFLILSFQLLTDHRETNHLTLKMSKRIFEPPGTPRRLMGVDGIQWMVKKHDLKFSLNDPFRSFIMLLEKVLLTSLLPILSFTQKVQGMHWVHQVYYTHFHIFYNRVLLIGRNTASVYFFSLWNDDFSWFIIKTLLASRTSDFLALVDFVAN